MKKILALVLTACMLMGATTAVFAAESTAEPVIGEDGFDYTNYYRARDPKNGEKYVIGYTYYWSTEFITLMNEGVKAEAEKSGAEVIYLDAQNDPAQQLSQVDSLIAQDGGCPVEATIAHHIDERVC